MDKSKLNILAVLVAAATIVITKHEYTKLTYSSELSQAIMPSNSKLTKLLAKNLIILKHANQDSS